MGQIVKREIMKIWMTWWDLNKSWQITFQSSLQSRALLEPVTRFTTVDVELCSFMVIAFLLIYERTRCLRFRRRRYRRETYV